MQKKSDAQLLHEYAAQGSEPAFGEIVARHTGLVYSAGLRQCGSPEPAREIAQSVFINLARKARTLAVQLSPDASLAGWLYRGTRYAALHWLRDERRRQAHERLVMENFNPSSETSPDWDRVSPVLDEAMAELGDSDREAVLLRFFQNRDFHAVGLALGVSDDAAQKRVSRAVERLREFLAKRGVTVGASGLVVVISTNAVQVAPAGLMAIISGAALGSVATASGTFTLLKLMATTKLKLGGVSVALMVGVLVMLSLRHQGNKAAGQQNLSAGAIPKDATESAGTQNPSKSGIFPRRGVDNSPKATAEEIVTGKLVQFGRSRREFLDALARQHGVEVPDAVKVFFDAVESGIWDNIDARFKAINGGEPNAGQASGRPPGVEYLWPAIIDAYGAAEQVHLWPPQKLLDYGNGILDSLRPGMIYVGGTDEGRWIPELLNDTSDGERRIVVTQNGLADGTYLEYLSTLYGDRLNTLTSEDGKRAFQEYVSDAENRLRHDQEHPDEPKQLGPGENVRLGDGSPNEGGSVTAGYVHVSGRAAVMAINEKLLQTLMAKNPEMSFAIQESFPLKGTYADALPLGPAHGTARPGRAEYLHPRARGAIARLLAGQGAASPLRS